MKSGQFPAWIVVPALACGAMAAAVPQAPAGGGAGSAGALEEIIVTAQRREHNVQSIPVAVSAFSAADMERRQITETLDLVRMQQAVIGSVVRAARREHDRWTRRFVGHAFGDGVRGDGDDVVRLLGL